MIEISQRGRFCAVCGTTMGPFLDNLCENCYKKEYPLDITVPEIINVEICPLCGNLKVQGVSISTVNREEKLEYIIREVVQKTILGKIQADFAYDYKFTDNIEEEKILNYGIKDFDIQIFITATPFEEFSEFEKELTSKVKLNRSSCDQCSKFKAGYFEGILQIRGDNRKLTEQETSKLESYIEKTMERFEDSKLMYIIEFKTDQDGITCKTSTKYLADTLAREIKNITSGKLSIAYELKTMAKDGTDVYTNTYLVKLPKYAIKDIAQYNGIFWIVRQISDSQLKLESLENRDIKDFDRKKVEDQGTRSNDIVVNREYMFVSSDGKNVVIMALDNYENYDDVLRRLPANKVVGDTIKGFIYNGKNYYLE